MSATQHTHLGSNVGIHATFEKADISREFILANSSTPPDFDSGPTASTRQRINSLQKPCRKLREHNFNYYTHLMGNTQHAPN